MSFPTKIMRVSNSAPCQRTIQLFVLEGDKVILVHDKGDDKPAYNDLTGEFVTKKHAGSKNHVSDSSFIDNKPPGWGLPGGGVDQGRSNEELYRQILRFLPVFRIDESIFLNMPVNEAIDLKAFLVAIKEGIEETGLLICPLKTLFEERNAKNHKVIVVEGKVLGGHINKRSMETDDCDWFELGHIPEGTYRSHIGRILKALKSLGLNEVACKVMVDEKVKETV